MLIYGKWKYGQKFNDSNGFDSEYDLESISFDKMTEKFNLWNDPNQFLILDKSSSLPDKKQTITYNYKLINEIINNNSSIYPQSKERGLQEINLKEKVFKITKDYKGKERIKKNTIYVGKHNKFLKIYNQKNTKIFPWKM